MTEHSKEEPLKMIAKWIEFAINFDIHDRFTSVALINGGVWWIKLNCRKMYRIKLIRIGSKSIETKQSNLKYIYAREWRCDVKKIRNTQYKWNEINRKKKWRVEIGYQWTSDRLKQITTADVLMNNDYFNSVRMWADKSKSKSKRMGAGCNWQVKSIPSSGIFGQVYVSTILNIMYTI